MSVKQTLLLGLDARTSREALKDIQKLVAENLSEFHVVAVCGLRYATVLPGEADAPDPGPIEVETVL